MERVEGGEGCRGEREGRDVVCVYVERTKSELRMRYRGSSKVVQS